MGNSTLARDGIGDIEGTGMAAEKKKALQDESARPFWGSAREGAAAA